MKKKILCSFLSLFLSLSLIESQKVNCNKRYYYSNSFVCVCNSTYCDTVENIDSDLGKNEFQIFLTNKDKFRLDKFKKSFENSPLESGIQILLNRNRTFQKIKGFGGAVTDATGFNVFSLSKDTQSNLIGSYFGSNSIEYNILRVPLGGTDFSQREYSYDDFPNDFNLTKFNLSNEDVEWKIPFIKSALSESKKSLSLFASAWSAPPWMKTSNDFKGNGTLIGPEGGLYYQTWANYYLKFFQEYRKYGIEFWGVTGQNEPTDGYIYNFWFNGMGFTPESQAIFISKNLAPTLKTNNFEHVKIMILDDQRLFLPGWAERVLKYSPETFKYVDGIAVHWYLDGFVPAKILDITHEMFPDKWIFGTEGCLGAGPIAVHVKLGDFERAESYAKYILQDLSHWVTGWTDWNMALDLKGGPNWANNFVDSPVIVNQETDEFYKQPIFYSMGHFSKFLNEGSVRVEMKSSDEEVEKKFSYVGFYEEATSKTVVILLNSGEQSLKVSIYDLELEKFVNIVCEAHSIRTIVWFN